MSSRNYRYDFFISYASADRAWVEGYLFDALDAAGIRYLHELTFELGAPRLLEFERALKESARTVLVLTPAYFAREVNTFVDLLVQSYGAELGTWPVIPLILQPVDLPLRLRFLIPLDASDPLGWADAVAKLCRVTQLPAARTKPDCPYIGMVPFSEKDSQHFFGRDDEIELLIDYLRRYPFAIIIGPSGCGKSSLVFAGLIPALRDSTLFGPGAWEVRVVRPGSIPSDRLKSAIEDCGGLESCVSSRPVEKVLLVVDQLEELFVQADYAKDGVKDVELFLQSLVQLAEGSLCYLVLTVRADFYPELMTSPLWPTIRAHRFELAPLTSEGLRNAIIKPAEAKNVYIESALVERLVADAYGEPGVLPFVQEVLVLLWEKMERRYLPLRAYEALVLPTTAYVGDASNGLQVAMARAADDMIIRLDDYRQAIARRILLRLIQFGEGRADTRRQQSVDALRTVCENSDALQLTLNYLADNRLITLSYGPDGTALADLSHEALIDGWPTLHDWIQKYGDTEKSLRRVEFKMMEWQRLGSGDDGLLAKGELEEVRAWANLDEVRSFGLSADLNEFIRKSEEYLSAQMRQQRGYRRLRRVVRSTGAAILLVVFLLTISIALNEAWRTTLNRSWRPVYGAPKARLRSVAGIDGHLVIGSYNYGAAWVGTNGRWTKWQNGGLPTGLADPGLDDPHAIIDEVEVIALDLQAPEDRYAYVPDGGLFAFDVRQERWERLGAEVLPRNSHAQQPIAVYGGTLLFIPDEPGIFGSGDGGASWKNLADGESILRREFHVALFDHDGIPYLLAKDGVYRGVGRHPFAWDRIAWDRLPLTGSVNLVEAAAAGTDETLFAALSTTDRSLVACINANDTFAGSIQPLPVTNHLLAWSGIFPIRVTAIVAHPDNNERFFIATNYGSVHEMACNGEQRRIGQRWFWVSLGGLAIADDGNSTAALYWVNWRGIERYSLN